MSLLQLASPDAPAISCATMGPPVVCYLFPGVPGFSGLDRVSAIAAVPTTADVSSATCAKFAKRRLFHKSANQKRYHTTRHHIYTTGPPISSRARLLCRSSCWKRKKLSVTWKVWASPFGLPMVIALAYVTQTKWKLAAMRRLSPFQQVKSSRCKSF